MKTITVEEVVRLRSEGQPLELIDVRTPVEFREVHAEGARSMPLDGFDARALVVERTEAGQGPVCLICRSGSRSRQAAEMLQKAGVQDVRCVEGGTLAWEAAGFPVVRGKKSVSLERQVRIAAGTLVAVGTALGAFVHPWFLGVPAFVGLGLVFAGLTDTCGMGMLLARMPWNRVGTPASTGCPS